MKKILIVGPSWVGDMMMAQVLFQLLHQKHVDLDLTVLAPAWSEGLLARMPEVNRSIVLPFAHGEFAFRKRLQFAKKLRAQQYDQVIVLPNSFKSALIPFFAHIPVRTGFVGECRYGLLNDVRQLNKQTLPRMIDRFAALALPKNTPLPTTLPIPLLRSDQNACDAALIKWQLQKDQPILALCPGAEFGVSKCWPPEYYATVANEKIKAGWQVWIFGSPNDAPLGEMIRSLTQGKAINLAGKTTLSEAIDLLALSSCVVTNDSGLMHIASSLDKPLIAIYGSTSPNFTPPLSLHATILKLSLSCQPCFQRTCPLKHHHCMTQLLPEQVLSKIPF